MRDTGQQPSAAFLAYHRDKVVVGGDQRITLLAAAHAEYGELFAKHGYSLANGMQLTEFCRIVEKVARLELATGLTDLSRPNSEKRELRALLGLQTWKATPAVVVPLHSSGTAPLAAHIAAHIAAHSCQDSRPRTGMRGWLSAASALLRAACARLGALRRRA